MTGILVSSLKGRTVVAKDGTEIGRVEDVQVDPSGWRVSALVVQVRRPILEKLEVDQPIIAGGKSLMLDPSHVVEAGARIVIRDDVWDVGRMPFR